MYIPIYRYIEISICRFIDISIHLCQDFKNMSIFRSIYVNISTKISIYRYIDVNLSETCQYLNHSSCSCLCCRRMQLSSSIANSCRRTCNVGCKPLSSDSTLVLGWRPSAAFFKITLRVFAGAVVGCNYCRRLQALFKITLRVLDCAVVGRAATFFFNEPPCCGLMLSLSASIAIGCNPCHFRRWPAATLFFNEPPCRGRVFSLSASLVICCYPYHFRG